MKSRIFFYGFVVILVFVGMYQILVWQEPSEKPQVIVSIPPLYIIAKEVMRDVGKPHLLMTKNTSPHHFSLKPSEAKLINSAKVIFWIGKDLEHGLHTSLETTSQKVKVIAFLDEKKLKFHKLAVHSFHGNHAHGVMDPHIWLDPENAIQIARIMGDALIRIDPNRKHIYQENTSRLIKRIEKSSRQLKKILRPYQSVSFAVFHNAYQYFQKAFGLKTPYALTLNPEHGMKIRRLKNLEEKIQKKHIKCLFTEPQFPQKTIENIQKQTNIKVSVLDPLGSEEISYVELLESLGHNIIDCFQNQPIGSK